MADIFISYSNRDRETARTFAEAFGRFGWQVWWDREIPYGKTFAKVIEDELERASCVVVLWSKESAGSEWVHTEAAEGRRRGMLVPVCIEEDVRIPLEFRRLQAADLPRWKGEPQDSVFQKLIRQIERIVGPRLESAASGATATGSAAPTTGKKVDDSNGARAKPATMRVRVTASAEDHAPFEIDAVAVEDDTRMVLSAGPMLEMPGDSNEQAIAKIQATRAFAPGSVVVKPGRPLRLLAIVHDLSQEPSWTEKWIREALANVLRQADERRLGAIGIPPLGTKHGSLEHERFIELLNEALASAALRFVGKIWLIVPEGFSGTALRCLHQ